MTSFRITVLVENTARGHGLLAEHGLALWIELGSRRILFDTGQTGILCHNADRLGVPLATPDAIVISHGHYDHTGGLPSVLGRARRPKVFVHPAALRNKFARSATGTGRHIGMPAEALDALQSKADITPTEAPVEIGGGLFVTGPIPRLTDFEDTGGPFYEDRDGLRADNLIDDQAAFLDTPAGVVVILGCAHAGIVNTLRYVRELLPARPIHTVIGGTHLATADETRMARTVDALREFDLQRLLPLHCTGFAAAARLWREFPGRVSTGPVGKRLDVDRS